MTGIGLDLAPFLAQALADPQDEAMFFRALPSGVLYVHAPISDDSPRLRLIQFFRPDGLMVLPVFTSRDKAELATGATARVLEFVGHELIAITYGTTWMIDPNDRSCTVYPEELAQLAQERDLPLVEPKHVLGAPSSVGLVPAPPQGLLQTLERLYGGLPVVQAAYLLQRLGGEPPVLEGLLIVLCIAPAHAERAVRATVLALQELDPHGFATVDLMDFDPSEAVPEFLTALEARPFFTKSGA